MLKLFRGDGTVVAAVYTMLQSVVAGSFTFFLFLFSILFASLYSYSKVSFLRLYVWYVRSPTTVVRISPQSRQS